MQAIITLCHSDEASGTTILDDGTKAHWTEGYSPVVVVPADGNVYTIPPNLRGEQNDHPVIIAIRADDMKTSRSMTKWEEKEHNALMQGC